MEVVFKEIVPIFLFAYLFLYEYKRNREVFPTIILFTGYISFSSNYVFEAYRLIFQVIQIILIGIYLFRSKFPNQFFHDKNVKFLCIYFVFIVLSAVGNSLDEDLYYAGLSNFLVIIFVIAYLNASVNTMHKLYKVLGVVKRVSFMVAVFTIICFVFERTRIELTTSNTNYLAFYLGIGLSISLFLNKKNNILYAIIIGLAIILTASRIVMISSILIVLIYVFSDKRKWFINVASVLIMLLLALSFVNIDQFLNTKRFSQIDDDISTVLRVEIIEASKDIIAHNPTNGLGYGQFQVKFLQYASKTSRFLADQEVIVTHNDFIRIIDELGVPAAIFILFILIHQFVVMLKLKGSIRLITLALFITTVLYSTAHNNLNTYMFWFFLMFPTFIYQLVLKEENVKENR